MLKEKKNKVIEIFKNSMGKYLALANLQETIICITYLYWNAKYVVKNRISSQLTNNEIDVLLQQGTKENQDFIWNVYNTCRGAIVDANIKNILAYFEKNTEDEIIDIICDDYEKYSRYSCSTPQMITELVIKILEQTKGKRILDMCSYNGNFLTRYANVYKDYSYSGIEINPIDSIMAEERLSTQEVDYKMITENVLKYKLKECYDKIFCNFPFGLRLEQKDYDTINKINRKLNIEFSRRITSDWLFVNSVINGLSSQGKAVVVMSNGALFKINDIEIRKELIENGYVETVISLPGKLFSNTGIETTLLVLSHGNKKIKFINATSLCEKEENKNILKVEDVFNEYQNENNNEITQIVDLDNVRKMSYSLLVDNYMSKEKIVIQNPRKIADLAEIFRGYQISAAEINQLSERKKDEDEYYIINISDINNGKIDKKLTTIYTDNKRMDRYVLENHDLLISTKGTTNKLAVIEVEDNKKYIASGNFNVVRLDTNLINPYYLKMFFESSKGLILLDSIRNGGVLPALNMSMFKEMEVPVPSMEEQEEVVKKYLAKQDEIEIAKNKLKLLEQSAQDIADSTF